MRIKSFRITNYKSFEDSGEHKLAPHMNVIVGQNNVGKTALLQAIAQRFSNQPHRNSRQRRNQALNPVSRLEIECATTGEEMHDALMRRGGQMVLPLASPDFASFFKLPEITGFAAYVTNNWQLSRNPSYNINDPKVSSVIQPNQERTAFMSVQNNPYHPDRDNLPQMFGAELSQRTYLFNALRIPATTSPAGSERQLKPNAENLPEVLDTLQPNRSLYKRFMDQVTRVLPLVKWISVAPTGQNREIRVWNVDEDTTRDDLSNNLSEGGTGIGQVLAILYVVIRSAGDIICIDEPNSFLHPGAAKALMTILNEHPQHQYIIATHSPEVIAASRPEKLFMLGFENEATVIQELDRSDVNSARHMLDQIGSRFSDVFGTDAVIWVEGPTEEECYPLLLEAKGISLPTGTVIARLRSTGDLEGKRAKACGDIYRNLSAAGSILPHSVTISLDGDKKGNPYAEQLETVFNTKVRFLPRRMYESYLVHPKAIASLLNTLPSFSDAPISADNVEGWIRDEGRQMKFGASAADVFSDYWFEQVDAAKLLIDLFQSISGAKESYSKTTYAPWLTRWLLNNDPVAVTGLSEFVASLLNTYSDPNRKEPS